MDTPICDFVRRYAESDAMRLHMPGHKGAGPLGVEHLDITEISGADSLYEASGIIQKSEQNAGMLFGAETFYSCEGSSLCIRAMLYLCALQAKKTGRSPRILAGRNAHKTFLSAVALLELEVEWLYPAQDSSYLSCPITAEDLSRRFKTSDELPVAVYLTSPDYLGNMVDLHAIGEVCHQSGVLLVVDNAHGAYLRFLPESRHPMDLGADLCCDSAHKTLPVITGGAYLHISPHAPRWMGKQAKAAMALFGSTSPSYLILQSLDWVNAYLSGDYRQHLADFVAQTDTLRQRLTAYGYVLTGDEPLKLTISTKPCGYRGEALAALLQTQGVVCEFADPDYLVLMLTPKIGGDGLKQLEKILLSIPMSTPIADQPPILHCPRKVMPVRQAVLSDSETIPAEDSLGRVLAAATVSCPPAVPVVVCGEEIDEQALDCFRYYGIADCTVVREDA